jgi:hypothetical protein
MAPTNSEDDDGFSFGRIQELTCSYCVKMGRECDSCFFMSKSDRMIESLQKMVKNSHAKSLHELAANIAANKIIADNDKVSLG